MNDLTTIPEEVDAPDDVGNIHFIERKQALEPGSYWRYTGTGDDAVSEIEPGTVLLLLSVDSFEGKPHTVTLANHPLKGGDGWIKYLIGDFLKEWQFAPDGEQVREAELRALQQRIADAQTEIVEGQVNPAIVAPAVEKDLLEWESNRQSDHKQPDRQETGADGAEAAPVPGTVTSLAIAGAGIRTDVGFIMENRLTQSDVQALKLRVEREAVIAESKARWLTQRTEAISKMVTSMTPFFKEKAAVALAKTSDVRKFAEDLMRGIKTLNLYTGVGVEVVKISTGASAPRTERLTLMQRKLFVEEELAVYADLEASFDFSDIKMFDEMVQKSPALLDQIAPSPRCVVSLAVRRRDVDYGRSDPEVAFKKNLANKAVFLLIRDGENVYRVYSGEETHENAARLFPSKDENDKLFTGFDGERIKFNDLEFTRRVARSEEQALMYKRLLVLLCGLDHRLKLFGDFYDEAQSLSFISMGFQQRNMNFVPDDEPGTMIAEARPDFRDWLQGRNDFLQSGSRVLAYYPNLLTAESAPSVIKVRYGRDRDWENKVAETLVDTDTHVVHKDGKDLCIDVPVRLRSAQYQEMARPEFNARVNLLASKRGFGYLCLDAVAAEDLEWYIRNRASRVQGVAFIRLFKRVAAAIRLEEAEQAPALAWLESAVVDAGVAGQHEAKGLVTEAVRSWRCANRGAPLPGLENKKDFNTILSLAHSLKRSTTDFGEMVQAYAEANDLKPLKAVLTGKNRLALYVEVPSPERDESLMAWRWVRRIGLSVLKTKLSETSSKLVWLTDKPDAKETEIRAWRELPAWVNGYDEPFKADFMLSVIEMVKAGVARYRQAFGVNDGAGIPWDNFERLSQEFLLHLHKPGKFVPTVTIDVPIAAHVRMGSPYSADTRDKIAGISVVTVSELAARWLYQAGNAEQKKWVRDKFVGTFENKAAAAVRLEREFRPTIESVDAKSMGAVVFFNASHSSTRSLDVAKHSERDAGSGQAMQVVSDTKRDADDVFARWMADVKPPKSSWMDYRPDAVVVSTEVWDGQRARVRAGLFGEFSRD